MITLLVQHGASVDYVSPTSGKTPLLIAVAENRVDAAKTLISCGASQWREDSEGKNAIVYAARHGSTELLACMLERCEDGDDGQGSQKVTSIVAAFAEAVKSGNVEICRYILDCTPHTIDISSAMCSACTHGHTDLVQFLLSR
jgi:ankyrin repeat protein